MEISTFCVFKFLSFACFVEKIGVCLESKTEFYKRSLLACNIEKVPFVNFEKKTSFGIRFHC